MATGYYLLDNAPARAQYRRHRRADPTGCIVVHTAENMLDLIGPDAGAENVARFITNRTDAAGSYHGIGDRDSTVWLVPFDAEAFHDRHSNRWSIGLSLAMRAADWPGLSPRTPPPAPPPPRTHGDPGSTPGSSTSTASPSPPRRITRAQSEAGEPGFIAHGDRDPRPPIRPRP